MNPSLPLSIDEVIEELDIIIWGRGVRFSLGNNFMHTKNVTIKV